MNYKYYKTTLLDRFIIKGSIVFFMIFVIIGLFFYDYELRVLIFFISFILLLITILYLFIIDKREKSKKELQEINKEYGQEKIRGIK